MKPIAVLCVLFGSAVVGSLSAQPTEVQLNRAGLDPARLTVLGEPGYDYRLESTPNLGDAAGWEFLATFSLNGAPESWLDARSLSEPQRFYRSIKLPQDPELAQDFRLIDQTGRSRWLFYYFGLPSVRAVTLLFTGTGCGKLAEMTPTLKALTNRFGSQGVFFWLIDSNTGDNRSNILAEATALGMSNGPPILHDPAQVVVRSYRASGIPEAVLVNMANFQVAYRGAIDDRLGSSAGPTTQNYLSNALVRLLAGDTVNPKQTRLDGCGLNLKPTYPNLSYAADIAPILQDKCARCHSPGNIGSFVMSNYNVIRAVASDIRHQVITGNMPPWHADPFYGQFSNDASLSPEQMAKLIQWIDDGAPRGLGSDPLAENAVPSTNYPAAWPASLGQPDAILRIPVQSVPASGTIAYRYITVVNDAFGGDVWLRAAVCRPSDARVVHHCLVFEGDSSSSLGGLAGFYAGYVPGQDPAPFPAGTGKLLKRGQSLTFQMHYTAIGEASTDQTELGLYLAPAPPTYPLQTKAAYNISFNVPANAPDYQATAQYPASGTLSTNIVIFEMSPHMHLRGARFRYEVIYPNGTRETILNVPNYIFHWQSLYRFAQPKYLPRGSRLICTGGWDNSTQNSELHEAYDESANALYLPTRNVGFGEQSWDEMFIGYMNYAEVPGPL